MAKEWKQICKDCGEEFGYSDISLQKGISKGMSRPERCQKCRLTHSKAIGSIASSHFALKSRGNPPSILGYEFLGQIDHGMRSSAEPDYKEPDMSRVDIGLNESNIRQVYDALENNQVVVVMAPTGSGKSTYIPSKLLYPLSPKETDHFTKRGPIIITQPRIAATIQIPNSIGTIFGGCSVGAGFDIGYCYSKDKENYDLKRNRMVLTTDGSLINWIADGMIGEFSMIVIDEAHERSYNIESIINMVYRELLKYPTLKIMIISATIDSDSFKNFFGKTTKVEVLNFDKSEKTYGYEEAPWKWKDLNVKKDFDEKIYEDNKRDGDNFLDKYKSNVAVKLAKKVIEIGRRTKHGGILGFLDGKDNINTAVNIIRDELNDQEDIRVLPFHGELSEKDRDEVIKYKFKHRRILIATNSAETSLTLEDIVYVVDSGIIKEEQWNSSTCRKSLETKFHSKAGCKQRWGRAGRVQKGFVEKLYSKEEFISFFPNYTIPAVQRSNSEPLILSAIAGGQCNLDNYEMLTKPENKEWERALSVVRERDLVDKDGDFTKEGLEIYELSKAVGYILGDSKAEYNSTERSLDVACLLLLADKYSCLVEAATAIAMMPHMGNSLYWQMDGLFKWNRNHNLISKDYQIRLHESLRAGCVDDLDFSCKLFSLFEGHLFEQDLPPGYRNWLVNEYAFNEKSFEAVAEIRNALINRFCEGKRNNEFRKINLGLINRVRILTGLAWNNKVVSIKKEEEILFENPKDKMIGVISGNCAGDWSREKKAITAIFDQNEVYATTEKATNKRERVPVANFMIKYLTPVPKNTVIEIINAIKKHSEESNFEKRFHYLNCDLKLPINRMVKVDSVKNPKKIISSFGIQHSNAQSENEQDLFIALSFKDIEKENLLEMEVEVEKSLRGSIDFVIELWTNTKNEPTVTLNKNPLPYSNSFDKLKVGAKVEATILRIVYNMRGIGFKEIVGYIASIDGFHYSLPIENIFIDYDDKLLADLPGHKLDLWKIGTTPITKQPIFSRTNYVEKERDTLFKRTEVTGKIIRKSSQGILCQVADDKLKFPHFVKIPIAKQASDRKFLQMDGEVTLKILNPKRVEPIHVDCVNDNYFDLEDEAKDETRRRLKQIVANKGSYSSFTDCGIEIDRTKLIISKRLFYDQILLLCFSYPLLSAALKFLHEKSWEMEGEIQVIQKKVEREEKSRGAKISLIQNISKNESILANTIQKRNKLLTDMAKPGNSSQWLAKANVWLQGFEDTIKRHEGWIREGNDKLNNWRD